MLAVSLFCFHRLSKALFKKTLGHTDMKAKLISMAAVLLSIITFVAITVCCLVIANPKETSTFVWKNFENETGWTAPGVAFLTGLININYGFAGLDGAIHLTDECLNAATAVPWALLSAIGASFITATIFMVSMLYCINDFDAILDTSTQSVERELSVKPLILP